MNKKQSNPKEVIQPTALHQVQFNDGMIVTAEDLQDAANYPLGVFKTLIRAFFDCGIVCGLEVNKRDQNAEKTWCVDINPGVALDCHGHPLELCKPVKLDLSDAYGCDPKPPTCVCIAMRRYTSEENPRPNSGCSGDQGGQEYDCTRIREQVLIKVFDPGIAEELPKNICMVNVDGVGCCGDGKDGVVDKAAQVSAAASDFEKNKGLEEICNCLKACPDKECCDDSWVLLACIQLDECGVVCIENRLRKYVKPIACLCERTARQSQSSSLESASAQFSNNANVGNATSAALSEVKESEAETVEIEKAEPEKKTTVKPTRKRPSRAKKT